MKEFQGIPYENGADLLTMKNAFKVASDEGRLHPAIAAGLDLPTGSVECGVCGMLNTDDESADLCCRPGLEEYAERQAFRDRACRIFGLSSEDKILIEDRPRLAASVKAISRTVGGLAALSLRLGLDSNYFCHFVVRKGRFIFAPAAAGLVEAFGQIDGLGSFPPSRDRVTRGHLSRLENEAEAAS